MDNTLKLIKYLCPAGEGVFTVSSGKEHKKKLQDMLYGGDKDLAKKKWLQQIHSLSSSPNTIILGIPSDSGGGIQRGANWGPLFVRQHLYQLLSKKEVVDIGDIRVIPQLLMDDYIKEEQLELCRKEQYGDKKLKLKVSPLSIAEEVCALIYKDYPDKKIFGIGGDHSVSYPLVKSYLAHKSSLGQKAAVIHFDAHTDLLPQRQGMDITFGSWTSHIIQDLFSPDLLLQVGIRATGHDRQYWQNNLGIKQYWASKIKEQGEDMIAHRISKYLKDKKVDELYITFDIDCLDEKFASATGTPESGGISVEQATKIISVLKNAFSIGGADLVEVAPNVSWRRDVKEPQRTLEAARDICYSILH